MSIFSAANAFIAVRRTDLPDVDTGASWVLTIGLVMGAALAFSLAFFVWFYVATAAYIIVSAGTKSSPSLARIARLVGIGFIFPLLGVSITTLLQLLGVPDLIPSVTHRLVLICGLAIVSRALADATETGWSKCAIALVAPVLLIEVILVAIRFL